MESTVKRRVSLQMKMLIGFLVGLAAGLAVHMTQPDAPWVDAVITYVTGPIGQIFLRLLFMLVIPLLFSALVVGIAEMGDVRSLKRVGVKTLVFTDRALLDRGRASRSPWSTCSSPAPASIRRWPSELLAQARASGPARSRHRPSEPGRDRRHVRSTSSRTTSSPRRPRTTSWR